jgi:NADPH2:quinone reductase
MTHAIRIHSFGGPEVLKWEPFNPGEPGPGEALIRQTAVGLNFIDVYERTGLYPNALPMGLGREGAGVVEALGAGVRGLAVGDRVAYASSQPGAYAQHRVVAANRLVAIPDGVSDRLAAAAILKGLTAQFLLRRTHRVRRGDTVVIHAASGGVGLIAAQWARHLGAKVIGVVGSEETFFASLDCLRPLGLMVSYGNASGPVPPIQPLELAKRGSLFLTRPTLFDYIAKKTDLARAARELFDVIGRGVVRIEIGQTRALKDVAQAHRDLEARRTVGSTVLIP